MKYILLHTKDFKKPYNHYIAKCPFCEKDGHFYMNVKNGLWDCKKCGRAGNYVMYQKAISGDDTSVINRLLNIYKVDLIDNDEEEDIGGEVTFPNDFIDIKTDDKFYDYFVNKRKFDENLINDYYIFRSSSNDYFYNNRIIIPIFDEKNVTKGFCARTILEDVKKRYYNSKGTKFSRLLFNYINIANNDYDFVVIVEGIFDALRLHKYALATFGKKLSEYQIEAILKLNKRKVILMYDSDAEQELYKYAKELTNVFEKVYIFKVPDEDPDFYFKNYTEKQKLKVLMSGAKRISSGSINSVGLKLKE